MRNSKNTDEKDPQSLLTDIRIKSGKWYVNSLGNTNQLFFIVRGKIDAFMISEVKLNETFLSVKFFTSSIFTEMATILSFIFDSIQP